MPKIILFNKPFRVLSQFSSEGDKSSLQDYLSIPGVYPAGRLDYDSEGLLLLTDDGKLQHAISHPKHKMGKTYWVQVEGEPDDESLGKLRKGVTLKDGPTLPCKVEVITPPATLWPRNPPIRHRESIPTSWLAITLHEGRNRQVRRMTAAIGFPTLRLIRYAIGPWSIDNLAPGEWQTVILDDADTHRLFPHYLKRPSQRHRPGSNKRHQAQRRKNRTR